MIYVIIAMVVAACVMWGVMIRSAINDSKRARDNEEDPT